MSIIDNDLLSIQQARILIENAIIAREDLKEYPQKFKDNFFNLVLDYFNKNIENIIYEAYMDYVYGNEKDELALAKFYLKNIKKEFEKYPNIRDILNNDSTKVNMVALPKGISICFLSSYLPIVMLMEYIFLSIKTACPIIIIPSLHGKNIIVKVIEDIKDLAIESHYSSFGISCLSYISNKGAKELYTNEEVAFVIENNLFEKSRNPGGLNCEWFTGNIGNNIVFIEKTANYKKAARDIVRSKSFNHGLLPGIEQSIVVEREIESEFKKELLEAKGYILTKEEYLKIQSVIYDENLQPRKGFIGRNAHELGEISGVSVPIDTKVLVVLRPYVSLQSPYSKEKYHPILSMYIEDDWRHACEKCIELILNDKKGQSLSIYTSDSYVIEQFVEKKPVSRLLINSPSGFGSVGLVSNLPISFMLSTRHVAGVRCKSLIPNHFMFFREIGTVEK